MILHDAQHLLYMEPRSPATGVPVIDEYTRLMAGAFDAARETGVRFRGRHICRCGTYSSNTDYVLPGELITNSLCVHYLAFHRHEVPEGELERVLALTQYEVVPLEPTNKVLAAPLHTSVVDNPGRTRRKSLFFGPNPERELPRPSRYVGIRER